MRLCKISAICFSISLILVLVISAEVINVFEHGKFTPVSTRRSNLNAFRPPKPLVVISPKEEGVYPILFFIHGTATANDQYTRLFSFIASHGIIVVAPTLFRDFLNIPRLPSHQDEIDDAAEVANWLADNLNTARSSTRMLPDKVTANFNNFTISGHSRGGKSAFALVLGMTEKTKLNQKISALIGLDPVAGARFGETEPYILTNKPNSRDLLVPTMIIGTGLSARCAPNGLNHAQLFWEAKEASHVVVTDFGHADMLNDGMVAFLMRGMCGSSRRGSTDVMRKTTGGLYVAFFEAYFGGNPGPYNEILSRSSVAPTELNPVEYKPQTQLYYDA